MTTCDMSLTTVKTIRKDPYETFNHLDISAGDNRFYSTTKLM